jgi:omega-6 fatty acid desaturase (delta-12 desaturase)
MCIYPFFSDPKDHKDSGIAIIIHFLVYAAVGFIFGLSGMFYLILLPFFIACGVGSYLFYAQHNFPTVMFKENSGWTYEGAALESSSFCKMNPIMHYFTGNIGYHHIHHLNSKIPFYRLPEVYSKMPELQQPKTTSLNPMEVFRCLKLKIWDSDQQKLVRLS